MLQGVSAPILQLDLLEKEVGLGAQLFLTVNLIIFLLGAKFKAHCLFVQETCRREEKAAGRVV